MKSKLIAALTAAALTISPTFAVETSPLPPGKPAGTKEAALLALGPIFWIGLVAIAVGIGIAVGNNDNNTTTTSTGS